MPEILPGLYLAHKAVGESSFDVVRAFTRESREAGQKKWSLGHGGTLDPFADGLLLVLSGQATRLMELMHPLPKTYVTTVVWGEETDTCDHLGKPVSRGDASHLTPELLDESLATYLGWRDQVPPATSAKKIGGESAYKKAHRGEEVILPPSRVYLHSARWIAHDLPRTSTLEISCKGGFYVRSLARELGQQLGCFAHLSTLLRTAIGPWEDPGEGNRTLITGEALIPWCPARVLSDIEADHLAHGRLIPLGEVLAPAVNLPEGFPDPATPVRAMHAGKLVALLRERDGGWGTVANLRGGL